MLLDGRYEFAKEPQGHNKLKNTMKSNQYEVHGSRTKKI